MHPLQPDITHLTDQELENKTNELIKKYFQALRVSPSTASQVSSMLEGYRWEQQRRAIEKSKKSVAVGDTPFDNLIKIN